MKGMLVAWRPAVTLAPAAVRRRDTKLTVQRGFSGLWRIWCPQVRRAVAKITLPRSAAVSWRDRSQSLDVPHRSKGAERPYRSFHDAFSHRFDSHNGDIGINRPMRVPMKMSNVLRTMLSRRGIVTGLAILAAFSVPPASGKERPGKDSAAKAFLTSIYQRYVGKSSAEAVGITLANAKSVHSYFTVGLASLILEDRAMAAKRGEPPVLGGDPFVGHQEWDISNLSIEVKDTGALKTIGIVTFTNSGKSEKIVIELLRSGNDWRIADIAWESGTLRGLYRRKAAYDIQATQD
jgi:hypothetical protein